MQSTETPVHDAPLAARLGDTPRAKGLKRYGVKSLWRTLQGEGAWAGRPAIFVRFVACNMWSGYEADRERDAAKGHACAAFCDTDFTKEGSVRLSAAALAAEAARVAAGGDSPVDLVVLTGGEPLLQADAGLIRALHAAGFEVAVETNGTVRLVDAFGADEQGWPDWVVCSPKLPAASTVIETLDELKLVVPAYRPADYAEVAGRVRAHRLGTRERRYLWVQPEDGPRLGEATRLAVELAQHDPRWRVSVQTHKILNVD